MQPKVEVLVRFEPKHAMQIRLPQPYIQIGQFATKIYLKFKETWKGAERLLTFSHQMLSDAKKFLKNW